MPGSVVKEKLKYDEFRKAAGDNVQNYLYTYICNNQL